MLAPDPDRMLATDENSLDELDRNILRAPGRFPAPHLGQRQGVGGILVSLDQSIVVAAAQNRGVFGQRDRLHHDHRYTLPLVLGNDDRGFAPPRTRSGSGKC
jgi:hypothetical protein